MARKEVLDLIISKVDPEKRETFIAEVREAKTKEERLKIVEKFEAGLTEEETKALRDAGSHVIDDEELDSVAGGGCCGKCTCYCGCG